jgi:hypothetical protein
MCPSLPQDKLARDDDSSTIVDKKILKIAVELVDFGYTCFLQ